MKRVVSIILGIWSGIACFFSPIWLIMVFMNITGLIYQYDPTMDEGTAGILGVMMLLVWAIFAFLPNIIFLRKMYLMGRRYLICSIFGMMLLCILGIGMCGWELP